MAAAERSDPSPEELEGVIAEILDSEEFDSALAAACVAHPAWSERIRGSLDALQRLWLLQEPIQSQGVQKSIGGFRMLEVLGRGGMGVVYRAVDDELGREVALKVLRPELLHFEDSRRRFQREIESASRLRHPGIVSVYSAGEQDEVPFFTMELVDGAPLSNTIASLCGQPLGSRRGVDLLGQERDQRPGTHSDAPHLPDNWIRACLQIIRMVAEALHHAHENGVVHRDVKPSNILIDEHGRARLLDFGLARLDSGQQLTKSTALLGSLPYMPPELVEARLGEPGPRQDVYSLGVTLYELLTLKQPFLADASEETRRRVVAGEFVALRRVEAAIGRECEIVCQKAMDHDPARRYASAREFADDLDNLLERRPVLARAAGPGLRAWRLTQRHPTASVASVLGVLVVLASVTAMVAALRSREIERTSVRQLVDSNLDFVFEFAQGLQRIPGNTSLRVKLLRQAADQLMGLEGKAGLDPSRIGRIGEAHLALAEVLGKPNQTNIGLREAAEERYLHVLEELAPRLTAEHGRGAAVLGSRAAIGLAAITRFNGDYDRTIELLDEAAVAVAPHLVDEPVTPQDRVIESLYMQIQSQLASVAGSQGRHEESLQGFEAVRERRRLEAEKNPNNSGAQLALASAGADVGIALYMCGDAVGAAIEYRPYLEQLDAKMARSPTDAQLMFQRLRRGVPFVEILIKAGELEEAISQGHRVIEFCARLEEADRDNVNLSRFRAAVSYNIGWAHQERAEESIAAGVRAESVDVREDLSEALRWLQASGDDFRKAAAAGRLDSTVRLERISARIEVVRGLLGGG